MDRDSLMRGAFGRSSAAPLGVGWNEGLGAEVEHAIYCASTARDMGARLPRAE
jgi:hypothetical protein